MNEGDGQFDVLIYTIAVACNADAAEIEANMLTLCCMEFASRQCGFNIQSSATS